MTSISNSNIFRVFETITGELNFVLRDEDGVALSSTAVGTFQLTLYNFAKDTKSKYHLATINGRLNQNVKNANNVTLNGSGQATYSIQINDMKMSDPNASEETH